MFPMIFMVFLVHKTPGFLASSFHSRSPCHVNHPGTTVCTVGDSFRDKRKSDEKTDENIALTLFFLEGCLYSIWTRKANLRDTILSFSFCVLCSESRHTGIWERILVVWETGIYGALIFLLHLEKLEAWFYQREVGLRMWGSKWRAMENQETVFSSESFQSLLGTEGQLWIAWEWSLARAWRSPILLITVVTALSHAPTLMSTVSLGCHFL